MEFETEWNIEKKKERHRIWHGFASFGISPKMQDAVLAYFEVPEAAVFAKEKEWNTFFSLAEQFGFGDAEKRKIREVLGRDHGKEYERLEQQGIGFVTQEDAEYPEKLRKLFLAPRFFYYKGTIPDDRPVIAIVGARNCSCYGSKIAWNFARELAELDVGIVSGLAYGVDKAAHDGALAGSGRTYAVLGCGVDVCYPKSHWEVYNRIPENEGGILSEYPPGTQPLSCLFPQRNRIIAGLSDGILVTEARKKSGSLITVSFGLEYGRNIYAVPGRIDDILSEGCNYLLKEGAKPVVSVKDILEDIEIKRPKKRKKTVCTGDMSGPEKRVLGRLNYRLRHIEELLEETGLEYGELIGILYGLLQKGEIKRQGQAYYTLA